MILGNVKTMIQKAIVGKADKTELPQNLSDLNNDLDLATSEDLNLKVDKVSGKELSSNDFTSTYKNKLDNFKWFMIDDIDMIPVSLQNTTEYEAYIQQKTEQTFLSLIDENSFQEALENYINSCKFATFANIQCINSSLVNEGLFFISFIPPLSWGTVEEYRHYICQYNIRGNNKNLFVSCINQINDLDDFLDTKLDSFQGVANSGKYLKIDSNGYVVCSSAPNETGNIDLSNYVEKSSVTGLIKNDGSIDRNEYLSKHQEDYSNMNVVINSNGFVDFEEKVKVPNYGYIDDNFNLNLLYIEIVSFEYDELASEGTDSLKILIQDETGSPLEGIFVDFIKQSAPGTEEELIETVTTDSRGYAGIDYTDNSSSVFIARISDTIEERIRRHDI